VEISEFLTTVSAIHGEAQRRGLYFQTADAGALRGRAIHIDGQELLSFSSCSYLGLEFHPALIQGVHDAVDAYGTQFSSSRGYLSAPPYVELEGLLGRIFDGHALVTSSTSMGHQIALGVLLTERDAIVMDHQVHYSVQMAANLARGAGAHVEIVRHSQLERAKDIVARLARTHRTVWFATDGVFSMFGDLAPIQLLQEILDVAPNVRLYVDDAHGMSWAGRHGRGSFLTRMPMHERMVMATSLNKAFSAAGGCLIFPTAEERDRVFRCGGPMVFSGPVQPPMLGAAVASAKLHLSDEITTYQERLRDRARLANRLMRELGMPLLVENEAPIFFIRMGLPRIAFQVAERMKADGVFVNCSAYPSVPMKRAGIRFTVTAAHTPEEIHRAMETLSRHIHAVLTDEKISSLDLDAMFARAVPEESLRGDSYAAIPRAAPALAAVGSRARPPQRVVSSPETGLTVEHRRRITDIEPALWDRLLGRAGSCSHAALSLAEQVFRGQPAREHNWSFHYVLVRDAAGEVVGATFFSTMLNKDDMLMRDEVSRAVEARRAADPYFLTSELVTMGSGFSEGNHLYLDRSGPWREALTHILEVMATVYEDRQAGAMLLRDLPGDDPEMDELLMDRGFVKVPMFDSHYLDVRWRDDEGFLATLSRRKRKHMRQIIAGSGAWRRRVIGRPGDPGVQPAHALGPGEISHLYGLYRNVANRKLKLNVFPLPEHLFGALSDNPAWELATFHLDPAAGGPIDGRAVAMYAAHKHGGHYAPFLCGLDYDYVFTHGAYRQMLYAMVRRARELDICCVHMGMDASVEKGRLGTRVVKNAVYLQARDHFNGELLREIVAEVGFRRSA